MIMLLAVTLYATAGTVIAAAFLAFGVTRVLPAPAASDAGRADYAFSRSLRGRYRRDRPSSQIFPDCGFAAVLCADG